MSSILLLSPESDAVGGCILFYEGGHAQLLSTYTLNITDCD